MKKKRNLKINKTFVKTIISFKRNKILLNPKHFYHIYSLSYLKLQLNNFIQKYTIVTRWVFYFISRLALYIEA